MDETQLTRELADARLEARISEIKTRLDGMDKALGLAQEYPTAIDKAVSRLRELHDQRFEAMEHLLAERRECEEKAHDKTEQSITAQLKSLEQTYESRHENTRNLYASLKERLDKIEGRDTGASTTWAWVFGLGGLLVGIVSTLTLVSTVTVYTP